MNKNRGFHVTVVDNKTGETVHDFNTRAIVYVMLEEIDEKKVKKEHGADMSCGFCTSQYIDRILAYEMLGIRSGLQDLIQDINKDHPELELLARLCDHGTIPLDDKED